MKKWKNSYKYLMIIKNSVNNNSLTTDACEVLMQLSDCIKQLHLNEYTQKINLLSNSTIGEHTRHIIELFQQLLYGYEIENINYDNRNRDIRIQENINFAEKGIVNIIQGLEKKDKKLLLTTRCNNQETVIESNYNRELLYNVEHCIHHQASIKVALLHFGKTEIVKNLGVAKSTIEYRKQCVQ
jgi:uncharacterized damage-inducible protein DinB